MQRCLVTLRMIMEKQGDAQIDCEAEDFALKEFVTSQQHSLVRLGKEDGSVFGGNKKKCWSSNGLLRASFLV